MNIFVIGITDTTSYLHKQDHRCQMLHPHNPSSLLWFHIHHHNRSSLTVLSEWFDRNFYHLLALVSHTIRNHQSVSSYKLVENIWQR